MIGEGTKHRKDLKRLGVRTIYMRPRRESEIETFINPHSLKSRIAAENFDLYLFESYDKQNILTYDGNLTKTIFMTL